MRPRPPLPPPDRERAGHSSSVRSFAALGFIVACAFLGYVLAGGLAAAFGAAIACLAMGLVLRLDQPRRGPDGE